jgi:hypothetical protein
VRTKLVTADVWPVNFFWDLEEARSHILIMAEAVASVELSADRASDEIG